MTIRSLPVQVAPPVPPRGTLRQPPRRWPTALRYLALYGLAAFFLMPIYVLVVTALKSPDQVSVTHMWSLPSSLSLGSFQAAWPKLSGGMRNSIVLAIPASLISSLLGCANGFVLSKWRFRPVLRGNDPISVDAILGFNVDTR